MLDDWAFYFITDINLTRKSILEDTKAAIKGGAKVIQYRVKETEANAMYKEALEVRRLTLDAAVDLIMNDRLDLALAVKADGIHLGQTDLPCSVVRQIFPEGLIGVSVGTIPEAEKAILDGASYIAASPVWSTSTKLDAGEGKGPEFVKELRKLTQMHITTIGGIDLKNLPLVLEAGADSACAISATISTDDVSGRVKEFDETIRSNRRKR